MTAYDRLVDRLTADGFKVGRRVLYARDDLDAWVKAAREEQVSA